MIELWISGTAATAVDADNVRPYSLVRSKPQGRGVRVLIEGDLPAMRVLLEDLKDRLWMDADPPHWREACRREIGKVEAAIRQAETEEQRRDR